MLCAKVIAFNKRLMMPIYLKINEYIFDASLNMHPVVYPPWLCLSYIHHIHCYLPTPLEEFHHQVDLRMQFYKHDAI